MGNSIEDPKVLNRSSIDPQFVLRFSKGSSAHQKVLKQFLSVCSRGIWGDVDVLHRVVCTEIFPHVSLDCTVPSLHNTGFFFIFS